MTLPDDMYKGVGQDSDNIILLYFVFGQVDSHVTLTTQAKNKQTTIHTLWVVVDTSESTGYVNFCYEIFVRFKDVNVVCVLHKNKEDFGYTPQI